MPALIMADLNRDSGDISSLVRDIRRGGQSAEKAFSRLFSNHSAQLRGYVLSRVSDVGTVDDIVQECFIRFLRSARSGADIRHGAYLWRAADSVIVDHHRRQSAVVRGNNQTESLSDEGQIADPNPGSEYDGQELLGCIEHVLSSYLIANPNHSSIVELAIIRQWSIGEMAEYLQRTRAATRQYLYEVRKKLRALIREKCGELF